MAERLLCQDDALEYIYDASEGDCRKAENILQACSAISENVTIDVVREVVSFAEPVELYEIITLALSGKFKPSKDKLADVLVKYGLSGVDAIQQIQKQIWNSPDFEDNLKVQLIKSCGEYEFRLSEGSNEFVQMNAFLADIVLIGNKYSTSN